MVLTEEDKVARPFTVEEAAEFLKIHKNTVHKWLLDGKIKGVKLGRVWRIPRSEIEKILKID